jgi:hypothetical protein
MQRTAARWIAVAALTSIFTVPLAAAAQPANPTRPPHVATAAEQHPEINAAIRALVRAKLHLQRAAHDFGGHRVEAIAAIDAALVQLKQALQYDKK